MSEDFLARHPEVRIEQVRRPIAGINDLTAPSYSCRECEAGKHDQCSGREYGLRWSFDCSCAKKTPHFERVEVAQVPLALLAELTKNTVYVVGELDLAPDAGLTREVDRDGTVRYRNNEGKLHREDGPAVEYPDGTREWYMDGKLHREGGPAFEYPYGTREWYRNGLLHREDGPAYERPDGTRKWFLDGLLHREDGPAIEWADGDREWYRGGKRHCEDGPAIEWADGDREWYRDGPAIEDAEGYRAWYLNDHLHREDGPAVERSDGTREWYQNGKRLSEAEFEARKPAAHQGRA